jgi:hypothetical protein
MLTMLQMKSTDVLMPDLQRMGGPTEFIRAGHLAAAFDVKLSSHLFSEMSLSLLAAAPNAYILEHMPWFEPIYAERIELDAEGRAIVPERPGWGFLFRPGRCARARWLTRRAARSKCFAARKIHSGCRQYRGYGRVWMPILRTNPWQCRADRQWRQV